MALPNIVNVTSIYGGTAQIPSTAITANTYTAAWVYQRPAGANSTTAIAGLTPATLTVNKIENIVVTNTGSTAVTIDVAICPAATFSTGVLTSFTYLASQISVPPNAALVVTDKSTSFYLGDLQSIGFRATATTVTVTASFEAITGPAS
jgi:hypothetical protein